MVYYHYRIQAKGFFPNTGFGFSCMHLAYNNEVTGSLFYESDNSAILEITGNSEAIETLIDQIKQDDFIKDVFILNKTKTKNKSTDFIMLNQID